jgi:penicillin-binding protein 1A
LGGGAASPLDMAQGYAMLANGGHAVKPYIIDAIFGPTGEPLFRFDPAIVCDECVPGEPEPISYVDSLQTDEEPIDPELALEQMADIVVSYRPNATEAPELFEGINLAPQAITPQNAFLIQDMMRDVIRRGTGVRAWRALGRTDLSGKTGTSNDRRDAWFGGFNADLAAVVWVGYDDDLPLGPREEGSRTALPIWIEFVRIALKDAPLHQMPMPDGIVTVRIDRATGCPAKAGQANTMFEVFRVDNVPVCEQLEDVTDPFNNAAGIDPEPVPVEEEDEASDSLF